MWFAVVLAMLLGTNTARAQTGTLTGTVTDDAGAALSGAEVTSESHGF